MHPRVDVHLHTTASDGTWDCTELLHHLELQGISLFSITDHDTIVNSLAMSTLPRPDNMGFILGVELSSCADNGRYHILSYDFDPTNAPLRQLIARNSCATEQWFDNIVKSVCRESVAIDFRDYVEYRHDPKRGGCKPMSYLLDRGVIGDLSGFLTLVRECGILPDHARADDVIRTVKDAGGYVFLAHPSEYGKGVAMGEESLKKWLDRGIDGIECWHPSAKVEDSLEYRRFCLRNRLYVSGGSDCHGEFLPQRRLGLPDISEEMVHLPFGNLAGFGQSREVRGETDAVQD